MSDFWSRTLDLLSTNNKKRYHLAQHLGLSATAISDWFNKKIYPQADKLFEIAEYLNTTPDYLIKGNMSKNTKHDDLWLNQIVQNIEKLTQKEIKSSLAHAVQLLTEILDEKQHTVVDIFLYLAQTTRDAYTQKEKKYQFNDYWSEKQYLEVGEKSEHYHTSNYVEIPCLLGITNGNLLISYKPEHTKKILCHNFKDYTNNYCVLKVCEVSIVNIGIVSGVTILIRLFNSINILRNGIYVIGSENTMSIKNIEPIYSQNGLITAYRVWCDKTDVQIKTLNDIGRVIGECVNIFDS